MTAQTTKLGLFTQAIEVFTKTAQTQRRDKLSEALNEELAQAQVDTAGYFSQSSRESFAKELAKRWQHIADLEARVFEPMLACNGGISGYWAKFLVPDSKQMHTVEVLQKDVPKLLRSRYLWEALDVTMKCRAQDAYRDLATHKNFSVRGVAVYQGELMFVYSYWNEEHTQLCLYRLPVREEDLPDLPAAQAAE